MTQVFESKSGLVKLEIRDQGMSAWLTIMQHDKLLNERDILDLIDQAGIKSGFEEAQKYIRENNLEKDYGTAFPLALCQAGAQRLKLNYYFDIHRNRRLTPTSNPKDFKDIEYVEAGTVVADYSSNLFDRQGSIYNIFGEIIPNPAIDPGVSAEQAGKGIEFDPEMNAFIAQNTGYPYLDEDSRICLIDELVLGADLQDYQFPMHVPVNLIYQGDLRTAEIFCQGSMQINGSVYNSQLSCRGNLEVTGDLVETKLSCEASLVVGGEIKDCAQALFILGDASCKSVLNSSLLCRGMIWLDRLITSSAIVADGGLSGGLNSCLQDTHLQACGPVEIASLGRVDGEATDIEITISPFYKAALTRLTKELIRLKEQGLGTSEEATILQNEIKHCEQQLDLQLNRFLRRSSAERYYIKVLGDVHPPVEMRILKHSYSIKTYQNSLLLEEKD